MSKFIERTNRPGKNNKFYNSNINPFVSAGFGMFQNGGNCTCYAWGRVFEILGKKPKLSTNNAENWWSKKDGYERGSEPRVGAVACYRKGEAGNSKDGAGHVTIVEKVHSNGDYTSSESGWKSFIFKNKRYKKANKYINGMGSNYVLQGFIYPPYEFDSEPSEKDSKPSETIYIVKKGDNLSKIAKKYNTTWQKIYNNNKKVIGSNPNLIKPGMKLVIK